MRKALVAIGVDGPVSGFPKLRAAATGAAQMASWGQSQGFDVTMLSDANGATVTLTGVFAAVQQIVAAKVYSQLVVYFSGHGILLSPDTEVWLLSGALANPNESINVSGSIAAARTSAIAHVVFVSDACRSMPSNFRMGMVAPGLIFPPNQPRAPTPEIDQFYATLPGDPALEVGPTEAEKSYRGLLTNCLLKALGGLPATLVEQVNDAGLTRHVVASRPLKGHLIQAVPDAAAAVSIKLVQNPDVRVESALPKYLADVSSAAATLSSGQTTDKPISAVRAAPELVTHMLVESWRKAVTPTLRGGIASLSVPNVADVRESVQQIVDSVGRRSFETRTGFSVHGVGVASVRVTDVPRACDVFVEGDVTNIRVYADYDELLTRRKRLALVRFTDGTGMVLSVLPGFVGSVVTNDGAVRTVNYSPSGGTRAFDEYQQTLPLMEERRAFVAVAARHGSFRLANEVAQDTARYLRYFKRLDPTLGLYAAYAYAQAGDDKGVLSVYDYMRRDPAPMLFDVAMLAAQRDRRLAQDLDFAPWLPALTQGWMLLGEFESEMPSVLREARQYLLAGLWTTFAKEGIDILEQRLHGVTR